MSHPQAGAQVTGATQVRTVEVPNLGPLLDHLPTAAGVAWIHAGDGMVAWGEAARIELTGPDQFERAAEWWQQYCATVARSGGSAGNGAAGTAAAEPVDVPVSGPIMFGTFAFDESTGTSVVVVPRIVLTRKDGRSWVTLIQPDETEPTGSGATHPAVLAAISTLGGPAEPVRAPGEVRWSEGSVPVMTWAAAVAAAVTRIGTGELAKVVLARDVVAEAERPIDARHLLSRLSDRYPSCWTFAVDGLVGASPELLIRRSGAEIVSLVLAGTAWRHDDFDEDRLAAELIASAKDQEEHVYATQSAAEALAGYCAELSVPDAPEVVRLANVVHLGTQVSGRLAGDTDALTLAAALHPTAAVAGTPTELALKVIDDLEGMDRGRYAGPVGWMDANGDGEWCIALRCAELAGRQARLFAGCGIVAGSVPVTEIAEAQAKFAPIRDALAD
ncbi:MAG: isochorismate synthase [Sporichthyaceae bacterium]|nr:isochorismate synthase [Sporichthyaceae bacterium]